MERDKCNVQCHWILWLNLFKSRLLKSHHWGVPVYFLGCFCTSEAALILPIARFQTSLNTHAAWNRTEYFLGKFKMLRCLCCITLDSHLKTDLLGTSPPFSSLSCLSMGTLALLVIFFTIFLTILSSPRNMKAEVFLGPNISSYILLPKRHKSQGQISVFLL